MMSRRQVFWWTAVPLVVLYALTRARAVTGEDSGELVTAAFTLGVGHPPGYPLWILLTRMFMGIVCPSLSPADAAALFSGLTTATAIGTFAVVSYRVSANAWASVIGALLVGQVHEIWNHATIAEVYPLNLLLFAWCLSLYLDWREDQSTRNFAWLATVFGFGVTNHPFFLLLLPVFGVAVVITKPAILKDIRAIGVGLLGLILPHLVYLQVYVAAGQNPVIDWGVKPTLVSVFEHYTREIYSHGPAKTAFTFSKFASELEILVRHHVDNVTIAGWIIAAIGLLVFARKQKQLGRFALALYVVSTAGLIAAVPFDVEREEAFAVRVFLMPAYLLLGFGATYVLGAIMNRLPAERPAWTPAIGLVLPLTLMGLRYNAHDRSDYTWSADYGRELLMGCPKDAVLIPGGDTSTFPVVYLQTCTGLRPDVAVIDKSGTIDRAKALSFMPEKLRPTFAEAPRDQLIDALVRHSGRPVVSMKPERRGGDDELHYVPHGLGFVAIPTRDDSNKRLLADRQKEWVEKLQLRNEVHPTVKDYTSDLIRSHLAQVRSAHRFLKGDRAGGIAEARAAVAHASGIKETINNTASLLADQGELEEAMQLFKKAILIRADYSIARRNLVLVMRQLGRHSEALAEAGRGLAVEPRDQQFFELGVEAALTLEDGVALKRMCAVRIEAVPDDPKPHKVLGDYASNREAAYSIARIHYEAALLRDPTNTALRRRIDELQTEELGVRLPTSPLASTDRPFALPMGLDRSDPSPRRRRGTQMEPLGAMPPSGVGSAMDLTLPIPNMSTDFVGADKPAQIPNSEIIR